ncbi:MAG TPA: hypothetical protein VFH72_03685 [Candidatus Baltobacteraceae bacterium]|nr:hypothetical protein [Candidatus Baltobacteraceae bacterium]
MNIVPFQRVMALLMAAAMVFVFLVPLAMRRHDYRIAAIVVAVFFAYLAFNAWLFVRMRRQNKS